MNFSVDLLKGDFRLRRQCWPKKAWICLGHSRDLTGNQLHHEHLRKLQEQDPNLAATVLPFIIHRDGEGKITMGWTIGQYDILAEDWEVRHERDEL